MKEIYCRPPEIIGKHFNEAWSIHVENIKEWSIQNRLRVWSPTLAGSCWWRVSDEHAAFFVLRWGGTCINLGKHWTGRPIGGIVGN